MLVPFAVENLGCRGNESRLLDCPVETLSLSALEGAGSFNNTRICSPFFNTYAFVACGTETSAGAAQWHRREHLNPTVCTCRHALQACGEQRRAKSCAFVGKE